MTFADAVSTELGHDWSHVGALALALGLSALIGFEREFRNKSAGLRTHTIIGFGAALIMLVSKFGFYDVVGSQVSLDPSRVAAQIVSGIGFIGGGLIFVRRDAVRGLTTAASVWLTTAVGMAAGAGMPILALLATLGYFIIMLGLTPLAARLSLGKHVPVPLRLVYDERRGVLRAVLAECTSRGFTVTDLTTQHRHNLDGLEKAIELGRDDRHDVTGELETDGGESNTVVVLLRIRGGGSLTDLAAVLTETPGVLRVVTGEDPDGD